MLQVFQDVRELNFITRKDCSKSEEGTEADYRSQGFSVEKRTSDLKIGCPVSKAETQNWGLIENGHPILEIGRPIFREAEHLFFPVEKRTSVFGKRTSEIEKAENLFFSW